MNQSDNQPISGESFFEPLPKRSLPIDQFTPLDESVIWHLNSLFWAHCNLWQQTYGEHYEASLPSGTSVAHQQSFIEASVQGLLKLLENLARREELPKVIYVLEQGPGTGKYAKGFLDYVQDYSRDNQRPFYDRLQYLLFDTSKEIITTTLANLTAHKNHIEVVSNLAPWAGRVLFVRHSNLWDQLPARIFSAEDGAITELQVQPVLDGAIEAELANVAPRVSSDDIVKALQTRTVGQLIGQHPKIWKPLARAVFLQTRRHTLSDKQLATLPFTKILQRLAVLQDGQEFVFNGGVLENIESISALVDWQRGGYIEVVDIVIPDVSGFARPHRPKKYDGSLACFMNGPMLRLYAEDHNKHLHLRKLRGLNYVVTLRDRSLAALLKGGHCVAIAEIAASKNQSQEKTLAKAADLMNHNIDIVCFSDQALVKSEFFKLSELADMNLFGQLPEGVIVPVLKARTKSKAEVQSIAKKLQTQGVKNLFVVTGDPSFESNETKNTSLDILPLVKDDFFCGAVAHPQAEDIPKTLAKIEAGAQFLIMQATYNHAEWQVWVTEFKKHEIHKKVPIIAVVMPVISQGALAAIQAIKDVSVASSFVQQFADVPDDEFYAKGIAVAEATIREYLATGIFSGIYVYSKSAQAIKDLSPIIR